MVQDLALGGIGRRLRLKLQRVGSIASGRRHQCAPLTARLHSLDCVLQATDDARVTLRKPTSVCIALQTAGKAIIKP